MLCNRSEVFPEILKVENRMPGLASDEFNDVGLKCQYDSLLTALVNSHVAPNHGSSSMQIEFRNFLNFAQFCKYISVQIVPFLARFNINFIGSSNYPQGLFTVQVQEIFHRQAKTLLLYNVGRIQTGILIRFSRENFIKESSVSQLRLDINDFMIKVWIL